MYEPSRHLATCHLAGFQHHEGALALKDMKPGKKLSLVPEPDNPFDAEAVALYFKGRKVGYVPSSENSLPFRLMYFAHDAVEARILQVDPKAAPWQQVRFGLYLKDKRTAREGARDFRRAR